jgi:hypothetical protein
LEDNNNKLREGALRTVKIPDPIKEKKKPPERSSSDTPATNKRATGNVKESEQSEERERERERTPSFSFLQSHRHPSIDRSILPPSISGRDKESREEKRSGSIDTGGCENNGIFQDTIITEFINIRINDNQGSHDQ